MADRLPVPAGELDSLTAPLTKLERKRKRDRERNQKKRDMVKADAAAHVKYCNHERDRKHAKQLTKGRRLQVSPTLCSHSTTPSLTHHLSRRSLLTSFPVLPAAALVSGRG